MWDVPSEKNSRGLLLCMLGVGGVPFVSLERQFANESSALENLVKHLTDRIFPSCSFACKVIFALLFLQQCHWSPGCFVSGL